MVDHAFANSRPFALSPPFGLLQWALAQLTTQGRTLARIRQAFLQGAACGPECFVGLNAWCENPRSRESITLAGRVLCRGILRVEGHGSGFIRVGREVYLGDNVIISAAAGVTIGDGVLLAHGVQVFDNNTHPVDRVARLADYRAVMGWGGPAPCSIEASPVSLGAGSWIGMNSIIMKGADIGAGSIVGAGSVVVSPIPPGVLAAGNPARVIRELPSA
ncbi:MAG: acyltransferase [Humidesulfovibrio sp.]|nr:acyltransferase [Humidesulfovibrio sp.]